MIEHCVAAFESMREEEVYRVYVTDALRAALCMVDNKANIERYYDVLHPKEIEERSGDEIVLDVIAKGGLKVVG